MLGSAPDSVPNLVNIARLAKTRDWVGRQFAARYQTTNSRLPCPSYASPIR